MIPKGKPAGLSIVPSDDAYVTAGANQVLTLTLTPTRDFEHDPSAEPKPCP